MIEFISQIGSLTARKWLPPGGGFLFGLTTSDEPQRAAVGPGAVGSIAFVEELPGANTQGTTLEETRENLREAFGLVLDADRMLAARPPATPI